MFKQSVDANKLDVVDFIIKFIVEHERRMDAQIERLELAIDEFYEMKAELLNNDK